MEFVVMRIDGDYAYLQNVQETDAEPRMVARALLPEVSEGTHVIYENFEYDILG